MDRGIDCIAGVEPRSRRCLRRACTRRPSTVHAEQEVSRNEPCPVAAAGSSRSAAAAQRLRAQKKAKHESEECADYIIGNPPYVSIAALSEEEKDDYRTRFAAARGRFDLYLLFFEAALRRLRPAGRLVFVTPEKYLYVEAARELRCLLARRSVTEIEFLDEGTFGQRCAYPVVTTVENTLPSGATSVTLRDGSQTSLSFGRDGDSLAPMLFGVPLSLRGSTRLGELALRVSAGVATGADEVFIVTTAELPPALRPFAYPTVSGRELGRVGLSPEPRESMLLPYARSGELVTPEELGALGEYLGAPGMRERLMRRSCVRYRPWYACHERPPLGQILRPKILWADISRSPRFFLDAAGEIVPRHSVYYLVPKDPADLGSLYEYLGSDAAVSWLKSHCQRALRGYLRLQSSVVRQLPVPPALAAENVALAA